MLDLDLNPKGKLSALKLHRSQYKKKLKLMSTCRLCGLKNDQFDVISTRLRDYDDKKFAVVCCPKCEFTQLSPPPSFQEISRFYDNDLQAKAIWPEGNHYHILEKKDLPDSLRRRLWIEAYLQPSKSTKVLDAGCGYGFFVNELSQNGFSATGIDLSDTRIKIAKENKDGIFLYGDIDTKFVSERFEHFDGVTSFHVLEHLTNPVKSIMSLMSLVKKGGYIFIEVPNLNDELIHQIPKYADHQWQFGHMSYFNEKSLKNLMKHCGLRDFTIKGVQRYGLDHLLSWAKKGQPDLSSPSYQVQNLLYDEIEKDYRKKREDRMTCDTLVLTIHK